jgi:hypothetical protein
MSSPRQRIRRSIIGTLFVHNSVPQTQKLGEHSLLPNGVEALIIQVSQGFLISEDYELRDLQIGTPLLNCNQYCQVLFFID